MKYILLIVSLLLADTAVAQVPGMVHYGQEEGLNASFTYMLDQDESGFIWIGSDNGLFRFDGTEFRQYSQKDGLRNIEILQPIALKNNDVFIVPYTSDFAYQKGGKIFNSDNNKDFAKIKYNPRLKYSAVADSLKQKVALYGSSRELFVYEKGRITKIPLNIFPNESDWIDMVKYDFKGNMLVSRRFDFYNYNIYTKRLTKLSPSSQVPEFFKDNKSNYLKRNISSMLILDNSLMAFSNDNRFTIIKKINNRSYEIYRDYTFKSGLYYTSMQQDGYLWIGFSDGGICRMNMSETEAPKNPVVFLKDYIINAVFVDRDGNVWFSTKNDGLFFMPMQILKNYSQFNLQGNNANITTITANKKSIFLGYNSAMAGVYSNNKLTNFPLDNDSKRECRAVFADEDYSIFSLVSDTYQMKLSDKSIKRIKGIVLTKNIIPIGKHEIMFCTSDSLQVYNYKTGKRTALEKIKSYSALRYSADSIFVGSFKDLYKYNIRNKGKKLFLKDCFFSDIKAIGKNLFIGATNGNGIYIFNTKKILRKITEADGLPSNQVKRLTAQGNHIFWAPTNSGISRILIGKKISISTFTRNDGLPSDRVSGCVIRGDTLFAGTTKGLAILPLKELLHQSRYLDKKVTINSVSLGGKEFPGPNESLTALYSDNPVIFNLSFPDYISQGKVSYRYLIEGLSEKWQTSKSSRILLSGLNPGKYTFKVYGLSYNGKRSDKMTVFAFEIEPLFWQTWWFIGLCILLLSSLIFMLILYFLQKRRDKKMQEVLYDKKIAELELQAIKAQINPHFIYNCLNSIQYLLYKKDYNETETYLDIFARMIRSTLHYSEKTFMPISEEADYLKLYLDMEKLRFKSNFSFDIKIADNVDRNSEIPSLLIQPFVENAIKHGIANLKGRKGYIEIRFDYEKPLLTIIVRDNGLGIKNKSILTKKMDSFGIKLSQKRIDTFSQLFDTDIRMEINDLSEKGGQGTEIKLLINQS